MRHLSSDLHLQNVYLNSYITIGSSIKIRLELNLKQ